jgi:hypothetical protein
MDPEPSKQGSGVAQPILDRRTRQPADLAKVLLVAPQQASHQRRPCWSRPLDPEHPEQAIQRRTYTVDVADGGLPAAAPGKVPPDEQLDRFVVELPATKPPAEVLGCEHVLMNGPGSVPAGSKMIDVSPKNAPDGVAADS